MNHLHVVEEVVGIERYADVVADFLRDTQIGRVVGTQAVGVECEGVVGLYHQMREVVKFIL